MEVMERAVLGK